MTRARRITVLGVGVLALALVLGPAAAANAVPLPTSILSGTIRDANGAALGAAEIYFNSGSHDFHVVADAGGAYSLSGIPAGTYFVQLVPPPASTGLSLGNQYFTVTAGAMTWNPVINFTSTVAGVVTDSTAATVGGVLVQVRQPDGEGGVSNGGAGTLADGAFSFGLGPGQWFVSYAPPEGSNLEYQWYNGVQTKAASTPFVFTNTAAGSPFDASVVLATNTTQVTGAVTLGGVPQSGAYVELRNSAGDFLDGLITDVAGNFSTAGMPSGTYTLVASDSVGPQDYISQVQSVTVAASDLVSPNLVLGPDPGIVVTGVPDAYAVNGNTLLTTPVGSGLVANDTRSPAGELFATLDTAPAHGDVFLQFDGAFRYAPDDGYVGTDTFTYIPNRFYPGFGPFGTAVTVTITVRAVLPPTGAEVSPVFVALGFGALGIGALLVIIAVRRRRTI